MIHRPLSPHQLAGLHVHWSAGSAIAAVRALAPGATRVEVTHLCPVCGSIEHGRPTAWIDGAAWPMSTSTAGPHRVTALGTDGTIGVDVESVEDIARRWTPGLVLHADETAADHHDRAWLWVAKEALLKAWGVGLTRPMTTVRLADHADDVRAIAAPDGYLAAAARSLCDPGQ